MRHVNAEANLALGKFPEAYASFIECSYELQSLRDSMTPLPLGLDFFLNRRATEGPVDAPSALTFAFLCSFLFFPSDAFRPLESYQVVLMQLWKEAAPTPWAVEQARAALQFAGTKPDISRYLWASLFTFAIANRKYHDAVLAVRAASGRSYVDLPSYPSHRLVNASDSPISFLLWPLPDRQRTSSSSLLTICQPMLLKYSSTRPVIVTF